MHSHLRTTRGTLLPKIAPFSPLIGYCIYGMTGNVRTREKILIIVGGLCCVKVFITCYRANTTTPTTYTATRSTATKNFTTQMLVHVCTLWFFFASVTLAGTCYNDAGCPDNNGPNWCNAQNNVCYNCNALISDIITIIIKNKHYYFKT